MVDVQSHADAQTYLVKSKKYHFISFILDSDSCMQQEGTPSLLCESMGQIPSFNQMFGTLRLVPP
jgi:hypothetical protein